jgi:protein-tyrosine phosphatase
MNIRLAAFSSSLALLTALPAWALVADGKAERIAPDQVAITWTDADPVDVYVSERPDADLATAKRVSEANRTGRFELTAAPGARPYILLRDRDDGRAVRVAERILPLERGSNFRDLGGYSAAGGKHVRWGMIYRSGGTPMLTDTDLATLRALGLREIVDLRSSEERVLAPTRINGVRYTAVGYSMATLMGEQKDMPQGDARMRRVYQQFPTLLAPQLRILFRSLIDGDGALEFNCSAGQDRTGFASALILTALGVPRDVVIADYHLSTTYRRPEYEMPRFEGASLASNPTAAMFAGYQRDPAAAKPRPLYDSQHQPLLLFALTEVETRWGSVDAYLEKELGVGPADLAKLRAKYLE